MGKILRLPISIIQHKSLCYPKCDMNYRFAAVASAVPKKYSNDGCETHMQVNHLAPALLTVLLLPSLLRGAPSRVVMVNSIVSYDSPFRMNAPHSLSSRKNMFSLEISKTQSKLLMSFKVKPSGCSLKGSCRSFQVLCMSKLNVMSSDEIL